MWKDKVTHTNVSIYTGDCFPIGSEIVYQLPDAKHQYTICTDTRLIKIFSLKFMVIPMLQTSEREKCGRHYPVTDRYMRIKQDSFNYQEEK